MSQTVCFRGKTSKVFLTRAGITLGHLWNTSITCSELRFRDRVQLSQQAPGKRAQALLWHAPTDSGCSRKVLTGQTDENPNPKQSPRDDLLWAITRPLLSVLPIREACLD